MSDDLRRVLKDPAHRLPDSLVDLETVHAAARRHQRRRTGLAAVGGAVVVAGISLAVVQPWTPAHDALPAVSSAPTPLVSSSPSMPSSPPPSPSPDTSGAAAPDLRVVGVSATSDQAWWVLREVRPVQDGVSLFGDAQLWRTTDAGASFSVVSRTGDPEGIPSGTSDVRFFGHGLGYALRVNAPTGQQLWQTVDGGRTWGAVPFAKRVLALEAGGGTGWLLVQDGRRIGAAALDPGLFENPRPTVWLGTGNGVRPALTAQGGTAVVFWFTDVESHLSVVTSGGAVVDRVNPCQRDLGTDSVSATADGLAVSCPTGMMDSPMASSDGGRTWSGVPALHGGRFVVGSINAGFTAVGGQDGELTLALSDSTQPLVTTGADGTGAWTWIGFTSQTSGFAIDEAGQLFHTDQRGTSWTEVTFRP